ncbi:STY4851/ECs_5259 family protein [Desulfatirhabdium butyrativorans]|uniref:STY4851/ECs_5259 family protein n=1 Tax=Desulfatirhabdium butyrativorans TaxID=340467 RepID=UPI000426C071|nr:STY4851/ECs_5259 family protein [Desulfatirhabdium butyrativorans]
MEWTDIDQALQEWLQELLQLRGLEKPDGRPLYAYRITSEEFDSIEDILRRIKALCRLLDRNHPKSAPTFGAIASSKEGVAAMFVLYAAEWWRRRFDGSRWAWEPILEGIGADRDAWNQMQRANCVIQGLRAWGLKVQTEGGLRYLGSIAVQGGLPLKMLAEAQGNIGNMLQTVLRLAPGGDITQTALYSWIESLQHVLPKSYRNPAVYTLLAQVAHTILTLKTKAALDAGSDPIQRLDEVIADWRDRFPLPVEDNQARGLIEQLIRDVSKQKVERRRQKALAVIRRIESTSDGRWMLQSSLDLPESLPFESLTSLFGIPTDEMPRTAELTLEIGEDHLPATLRRLAGQNAYRVERMLMGASGEAAALEHVLRLTAPDGRMWSAAPPKGDPLQTDLPWVFSVKDGRFLREGNGAIVETEAWIALPQDWSLPEGLPQPIDAVETLQEPARQLVRIRETIRLNLPSGQSIRIRTGQTTSGDDGFKWVGRRLWLECRPFRAVFIGEPILYRTAGEDSQKPVSGKITWKAIGSSASEQCLIGPVEASYAEAGECLHRRRMVLLPKNARIAIDSGDSQSGTLRLIEWGCAAARSTTPGVRVHAYPQDDDLLLDLEMENDLPMRPWADVEIYWKRTTTGARFRFPFPAEGVLAFDANGSELATNSLVCVQRLFGVRLQIMPGNAGGDIRITFSIGNIHRTKRLRLPPDALFLEIRLRDHIEDIEQLLSSSDHLDATVIASILFNGMECFRLQLVRYAVKLNSGPNYVSIQTAEPSSLLAKVAAELPVMALRMECPGDEGELLERRILEDTGETVWVFDPDRREPGAWLLYPGANAELPFRPRLWTVRGETPQATSPLSQAIALPDVGERQAELDRIIQSLAANFLHEDWAEVERLAGQIGHLPLTTLDLWRRFVRHPEGMAALALRHGIWPTDFLERFALELPFAWETIPYAVWVNAMARLQKQCIERYGPQSGAVVLQLHLKERIDAMISRHGALHFVLGIAGSHYLDEMRADVERLRPVGAVAKQWLFEGENSLLMQLRRLHAEDTWPTEGKSIVASARELPVIARYLYGERLGYPDVVISLPLLLAVQAATGDVAAWFDRPQEKVHTLRSVRSFDPEWFDEAYNQTIARCYSDGVIQV